jgi:ABC-type multidrug transport system fused ATPase/permease subunit
MRSLLDQQVLWIGENIRINLVAILKCDIYTKTLRRKATTSSDTVLGGKTEDAGKPNLVKLMFGFGGKKKEAKMNKDASRVSSDPAKTGAEKAGDDLQANTGTTTNLMSVDSVNVADISGHLFYLLSSAPTQLAVCVILLWQILGLSSIPGLVATILLLLLNTSLAASIGRAQKKIMAATDGRTYSTNEVLQNIRTIKFLAWEHRFGKIINEKRATELKALRRKHIFRAIVVAVWIAVPFAITFSSFLVYTLVEKKPMYFSIAIPTMLLFNLLCSLLYRLGNTITSIKGSAVSINCIEEFLNKEETDKYNQLCRGSTDDEDYKIVGFKNATFTWAGKDTVVEDSSTAFRLIDIDIEFAIGKLNIIAGPTGSGKTSLFMALLGEMTILKGRVYLPGGYSREDVQPDPETGLTDTVAYCAQQAWLVNTNIKENILFGNPMDEQRYRDVIAACALERDLEILDAGDETLVGEKGIMLSGGQKQRISLARALYSNSRHVLLDDCLSAVDSHTAKWIFDNCIMGPLMQNRICILATYNIVLCIPFSEYVVVLDNGKIAIQGAAEEVMASGKLGKEANKIGPQPGKASRIPSSTKLNTGEDSKATLIESNGKLNGAASSKDTKPKDPNKGLQKDAMDEDKAEGGVKFDVIMFYFKAMGPWWFWVVVLSIFGMQQISSVAGNIWIRQWANQYNTPNKPYLIPNSYMANTISTDRLATGLGLSKFIPYFDSRRTFILAMPSSGDIHYYLLIYALIGASSIFATLFRTLWLYYGSLTVSWTIHQQLLESVTRAKFKFFDIIPLGQIINRFSKDLQVIDQEVAIYTIAVMSCTLAIVVAVVLISIITPGFLVAAFFISLMYFLLGRFYIRSSRDLKRLESVQTSPLFQQFSETLSGITTIRAYGNERRFIRDNMLQVNTCNRLYIYLWATNR